MATINPLSLVQQPPPVTTPNSGNTSLSILPPATAPATLPGAPVGGTPQEALQQVLQMIIMVIMALIQGDASGASLPPAAGLTPGLTGVGGTSAVATPPPAAAAGGPLRIAQIDSFSSEHGEEIADLINGGGTHSDLVQDDIDLLQYDIGGGSNQKINDSLRDIIMRVQSGERIDAVNMSLQDFTESDAAAETSQLVDQLIAMGIPVAVAAGNDGPGAQNFLEGQNSFNVESFTNGMRNGTSGLGNVQSDGSTTSYATANLTPLLASLHAQGMSIAQIRAYLANL
jgi:hypothetical protein